MTAAEIAGALEGKRSGRQFLARCPAHDDSNPSLSIAERNGKVLVKCFAGCEQADVIGQLKARGLWPESGRRENPPEWGTIFRTYDYTDENGTLLYQICRFLPPYEPPPKEWGKCKPRRPDGCGWRWGIWKRSAGAVPLAGTARGSDRLRSRRRKGLRVASRTRFCCDDKFGRC